MDQAIRREFDAAYDTYAGELYRYVRLRVSDSEGVEDIMSDVFVRFWQKLQSGESVEKPRALLYAIAYGLIVDSYRRKGVRQTMPLDDLDQEVLRDEDQTVALLERRDDQQSIMQGIEKIRPEYKDLILLHYVEDLDIAEIAEVMQKRTGAVRVQLHRALKALKQVL